MFYIKENGTYVEITQENVFTDCPACGASHHVDLADLFRGDDDYTYDLMHTRVYCEECTKTRAWEGADTLQ